MPREANVDYLLLDERGFPIAVLEAKSEKFDPLVGKEEARRYAHFQNVRFVILSNGNLHYFWDLQQGNPVLITEFPRPDSFASFHAFNPKVSISDIKALNGWRDVIPEYVKDYVSLNQFAA